MTTQICKHDTSPAGSDPDCIVRISQTSAVGRSLSTNGEMVLTIVTSYATDINNIDPTIWRPERLSCNEKGSMKMFAIHEQDKLRMETGDVRVAHIVMQCMIEYALYVLKEAILGRDIEVIVETEVFSLFETANWKATKVKDTPV